MNVHAHSTIFNRKRGCLMAVAETAKCSGKASGESRGRRRSACLQRSINALRTDVDAQTVAYDGWRD